MIGIDILAFMKHAPAVAELRIGQRGPVPVYHYGRLVGTVPGWPVRSTSMIYDVRADDFVPRDLDGIGVLDASPRIGPGDVGCVQGFVPADGVSDGYTDRSGAELFDDLARAMRRGA